MGTRIKLGHVEAHEKLTARLFWRPIGEIGYIDAGNVREYRDASTRTLVTRVRAEQGTRYVDTEEAGTDHEAYEFLLDERVPNQERLIKLAQDQSDQRQNAVEGTTATFESVTLGRWYDIGAYGIANARVHSQLGGIAQEGTDYNIDLKNGRIELLEDAGISEGDDVVITFDQPGMRFEKRLTQKNPVFFCDIVIELHNQYSKMWLRRKAFQGFVNVIEFPTHGGEFASYRAKVTSRGPVTVLKRQQATDVPEVVESGAAANSSSSSSSSSTFSSSSSGGESSSSTARSDTSSQSYSSTSYSSASSHSISSPSSQSSSSSSSSTAASVTSSSSSSTSTASASTGSSASEGSF